MNQNNKYLKKEYYKILFPLMLTVLGGTINALIDSVFVSQCVGADGLSAITASMPVYLIMCTLGSLIAGGAWIDATKYVGREELGKANLVYHNGIWLAAVFSIVFTFLGVIFAHPISNLLAPAGIITEYTYQYVVISFLGCFTFVFVYFPSYFLQLEGKAKAISYTTTIMVVTDIALDFLFLAVLKWGMYGAAIASLLANTVSTAYGFYELQRKGSNFAFSVKLLKFGNLKVILEKGSTVALGNFYDTFKLLFINILIGKYFTENDMAVWAVLNTISELALIITSGIPKAAVPMLGVYSTARENGRIRMLIKIQTQAAALLAGGFLVIIVAGNTIIRGVFNCPESLLIPLACLGIATYLNTISNIWSDYCKVSDKVALANIMVFLRRFLTPVLFMLVLLKFKLIVWFFLPLAAAGTLVISFLVVYNIYNKRKHTNRPVTAILLLDDHLTRDNKVLDFSLKSDVNEAVSAAERISEFCMDNSMSTKQSMKIQLAVEELIGILIKKNPKTDFIDARVYALDDIIGVQFRYAGGYYNPFEDDDEEYFVELSMIKKIGDEFRHSYILGANTIRFNFWPQEVKEQAANSPLY